jgi:hypothetical protein
MTAPDFQPQPSTAFSEAPAAPPVEPTGPDHTASADLIAGRVPKVNQKHPPRASTVNGREKPTGMGLNKQPSSGIRKLNKTDGEKIASMYTYVGMGVSAVNMRLAKAIATNADTCGEAWVEWGNENDKLRRRILAFLEGGAATKVFMAHAPILAAAVPPDFIAKTLARFGMTAESEEDAEE